MRIHKRLNKEGKIFYICNQAFYGDKKRTTTDWKKVTCQNCMKHKKKKKSQFGGGY